MVLDNNEAVSAGPQQAKGWFNLGQQQPPFLHVDFPLR